MDTSVVKNIFVLFITQLGTWLTQIIHAWEGHGCTTKELPNGSKHHEKNTVWYIYMMPCLALLFQHQIQTLSSVLSLEKHLSDPQCVALRHMVDGSEACELSGLFSKPQA